MENINKKYKLEQYMENDKISFINNTNNVIFLSQNKKGISLSIGNTYNVKESVSVLEDTNEKHILELLEQIM